MKNQELPLKEIQQWTLLGPLLMSVTLFVILFTPTRPFLTALIAIIGLPLCWKWKLSGAAWAVILLTGAVTYQAAFNNEDQLYWQVASGLTVALTFYLTALCSKEVDQLFADLPVSADDSPSPSWQNTDTELMALIQKGAHDQKVAEATISGLKLQLTDKEDQLHAKTQMLASEQKILLEIQGQNETLLQELFQCRHECTILNKHSEELLASSAQKEALLLEQLEEAKRAKSSEFEPIACVNETAAPATTDLPKSRLAPKGKAQKQTKTTHWANTILSRCSEPHDPQK